MILYLGNFIDDPRINPTFSHSLAKFLAQSFPLEIAGRAYSRPKRLREMVWALLTKKPNVLLVDAYATKAFWYLVIISLIARFRGIPFIPILHSGAWVARFETHRVFSKIALRKASHLVCTSEYLHMHLPSWAGQASTIHNFAEVPAHYARVRESFEGKVLWVREYQPRYGDELVLELANELEKRKLPIQICMVGPKKETLFQRWQGQVPSSVTLLDRQTPEAWYQLAQAYSLFLNTTRQDSFPISLLEAQQLGLPVLSTAVGGIPELISPASNGWLVAQEDVLAMAEILESLVKAPEQINAISKAALAVGETFRWASQKAKWYELLAKFH